MALFLRKRLRRNSKCVLFVIVLMISAAAVYHEMVAVRSWSIVPISTLEVNSWRLSLSKERDQQPDTAERSTPWKFGFALQKWSPENKGRANLHVFEDWCGTSVARLRKNTHYPLHPHTRTTVEKLAVSPRWTNYGLRIFGYLHPHTDGEFVFAVSSDDNSEFWLSTDDSPLEVQLLAWVGNTGAEWTAPGEFQKYASQTSRPVWLSAQKRYFFEILHKQDDQGTDHVEVAWKLLSSSTGFSVIESSHISLYADESALLLSDVAQIPQTAASHQYTPTQGQNDAVDMKREDPRDTFYKVPLINGDVLRGVLPNCAYKPTYTIKGYTLQRYEGLQYVHLSHVYPNDYTRLTHMENQDSCFYHGNYHYLRMMGFSRYMKLDHADPQGNSARDSGFPWSGLIQNEKYQKSQMKAKEDQMDYGDDYDDYAQDRRRKLFSIVQKERNGVNKTAEAQTLTDRDDLHQPRLTATKPVEYLLPVTSKQVQQGTFGLKEEERKSQTDLKDAPLNSSRQEQVNPWDKENVQGKAKAAIQSKVRRSKTGQNYRAAKKKRTRIQKLKGSKLQMARKNETLEKYVTVAEKKPLIIMEKVVATQSPVEPSQRKTSDVRQQEDQKVETKMTQKSEKSTNAVLMTSEGRTGGERSGEKKEFQQKQEEEFQQNRREEFQQKQEEEFQQKQEEEFQQKQQEEFQQNRREEFRQNRLQEFRQKQREEFQQNRRQEFQQKQEDDRPEEARSENAGKQGGVSVEKAENAEITAPLVFVKEIDWSQTFQVDPLDLQQQRSDRIDLTCNISGNMLLGAKDALLLVQAFMGELHKKHPGLSLARVVNVEKRVDGLQGSRYLLELEVKDGGGQPLRLSQYIYALHSHSRFHAWHLGNPRVPSQQVLCNPVGFKWNPAATVNIIVPVKNQGRWVQQLISDMEKLFQITGDANFNLIITDYSSTDMDVKKALQRSALPRYQYLKLDGPFQRSAGLQAGIDLVKDQHSILFLCDLHIDFPHSIVDSIRKHTVEGHMVFAPIVMRLDCGSTPQEARGFWEVNGFGLLGIYKSDLDAIGGMNTKEYTNRWGGEDWELIDRILQGGLEVERIYLRNFFHHYHSKRGMWNQQMVSRQR